MSIRSFFNKAIFCIAVCFAFTASAQQKETSGNPVIPVWNADPEAKIFNHLYWIYPTYSAPYDEQVHMDAWSSPDLVHWTKYSDIIDTAAIKKAKHVYLVLADFHQ